MNESSLYAHKPPACSSPIVSTINGKEYRIHYGHSYGNTQIIAPSVYPAGQEDIKKLNEEITKAELILQ